jgi:serine/threonine-protein kinase
LASATKSFVADRIPTATDVPQARDSVSADEDADQRLPSSPLGYELLRELGHGGMGSVYLAREGTTERIVAMKFLRGAASQGMARFFREVRALGRLEHPNIIRVLSTDFSRSDPYFTMEYAPGGSLSDRVKERGRLAAVEAAAILATAARAIHAAHQAEILHRDLKPSNILVMADGTPKISDFGLAKRTDVDDDLTATGPVGTPPFMPPEQASTKFGAIGPRSDVYSLGASLYYLVTARLPFTGPTQDAIIARVLTEIPERPRTICPDLPGDLEGIIVKCLEKQPAARYQSAAALADDLERFLAGQAPLAPRLTSRRRFQKWARRNRPEIAASLLAACLLMGTILFLANDPGSQEPGGSPSPLPQPAARKAAVLLPAIPVVPGFTPELTYEQVQQDLRRGTKVTLVGPTAPRIPLAFGLGTCDIIESSKGDTKFSLRSRNGTILHLLSDPGIDRYRLRVQLRQELRTPSPGGEVRNAQIGVVVGHARVRAGQASVAHSLIGVGFTDHPAGPAQIGIWDEVKFERPLESPISRGHRSSTLPLELRPGEETPWRTIEIDVSPEGITIHHDDRSATCTSAEINRLLADREEQLRADLPPSDLDFVLPSWSPRLPLGIWVFESWASVRNVSIEPSP